MACVLPSSSVLPPSSGLSSLINGNHAANLLNNNSLLAAAAANNGVLGQTLLGNPMGHNNNDLNILNNNNNNPLMLDKNGGGGLNGSSGCGDHLSTTSNASTPSTGSITGGEQPDPDFIKMFVGQVPKSMDEEQLRDMFEEYGRVHSINVLRDKVTGVSKGEFGPLIVLLSFPARFDPFPPRPSCVGEVDIR